MSAGLCAARAWYERLTGEKEEDLPTHTHTRARACAKSIPWGVVAPGAAWLSSLYVRLKDRDELGRFLGGVEPRLRLELFDEFFVHGRVHVCLEIFQGRELVVGTDAPGTAHGNLKRLDSGLSAEFRGARFEILLHDFELLEVDAVGYDARHLIDQEMS